MCPLSPCSPAHTFLREEMCLWEGQCSRLDLCGCQVGGVYLWVQTLLLAKLGSG